PIGQGRAGVLARLPGNPICWGYSGTLLDKSPRCLLGVLWALEMQAKKPDIEWIASGWAQNKALSGFRGFDIICKNWEECNKSGSYESNAIVTLGIQLIHVLETFMIRLSPEQRWFGHPLVVLNTNLHRDVFLKHHDKYDEHIRALAPEIKSEAADRLQKLQTI